MEIKDIDLTKCVNCCYKAVIDGVDDRGRICGNEKDVYLRSDVKGLPVVSWDDIERGFTGKEVKGFEIVPRDPETYQDWQVGDIVLDSCEDSDWRVIFRSGEFVVVADNCSEDKLDIIGCYTCSQLFREGWRLILTDIEDQIIEEKKVVEDIPKPYKFKKGEPVLVRDNGCVWKIGVFTEMRADYFQYGAMTNGLDECGYHYCLPYNERTMHLLGTTEDYREE